MEKEDRFEEEMPNNLVTYIIICFLMSLIEGPIPYIPACMYNYHRAWLTTIRLTRILQCVMNTGYCNYSDVL